MLAGGVLSPVACFEELPPPIQCPPAAQRASGDCSDVLNEPVAGCFSHEGVACLTGKRASCACVADECPAPAVACYPDGDCPAAVDVAVPGATCTVLDVQNIGAGIAEEFMCMCGCAGCAAVCDGRGPVVGLFSPDGSSAPGLVIDLGNEVPDQGKLGLYLRVRGAAFVSAVLGIGDVADLSDAEFLPVVYPVLTGIKNDFVELVLYQDDFLMIEPYEWTDATRKPNFAALLPKLSAVGDATVLFELDCVIPFYTD